MMLAAASPTRRTLLPENSPALRFTTAWFDATERFNSAVWAALTVPSSSASLLAELRQFSEWVGRSGFGRDCFPSPSQFNLLECIWHAHDGEHRPTVAKVIEYMKTRGWTGAHVGTADGDLRAEIRGKLEIESSAAGLLTYAERMLDYRDRDGLAARMRKNYRRLLDPGDAINSIIEDYTCQLTHWRDRCGERNHG